MNSFNTDQRRNSVETALVVLLLLILLSTLYTVLSVFLGVFTYAIILAVAIHPLFEKLVRALGGRRKLAAFIYGLLLVAIVALPYIYLINELANYAQESIKYVTDAKEKGLPALPDWIAGLPVVGDKISTAWPACSYGSCRPPSDSARYVSTPPLPTARSALRQMHSRAALPA